MALALFFVFTVYSLARRSCAFLRNSNGALFGWQRPEKSGKSSLEFDSKEKHAPSPEQRTVRRGSEMRIGKTIGGKLYLGFGLVLGTVIVMFLVNYIAVLHEQSTRALYQKSIKMADNLAKLGQTRFKKRLHLRKFLLNGDGRE